MLILPDKRLLGDGVNGANLRNEDSLAYLRAKNDKDLERFRWNDQADMTNCEKRQGRRMHRSELIRRVRSLNGSIWVEQQINFPDDLGFYDVYPPHTGTPRYLSSFSKEWMPEFSYLLLDWQNIPETEVRGWRTAIVRLLKLGALSWNQVHYEFGDPTEQVNALRWYAQTADFRTSGSSTRRDVTPIF